MTRPVLIWCSAADAAVNKNAVMLIYQDNGFMQPKPLFQMDWRYAAHVSCCDQPWCVVSTFAPDNSLPSQLWKVPFDGSAPELLCDTGAVYSDYDSAPMAALSSDGSRLVWRANGDAYIGTLPAAVPQEIPIPAPTMPVEPPIVVRPVNPLAAELATAKMELLVQDALNRDLLRVNQHLRAQFEEAQRVIAGLHEEQKAGTWEKVDFAGQVGRRWTFEVLPSLHLRMYDMAADGTVSPITTWRHGNEYLFRAVMDRDGVQGFAMLTHRDNT